MNGQTAKDEMIETPVMEPHRRAADAPAAVRPVRRRRFDGVICFGGEDWWYHNRGHFDMQMMRRLAQRWPVLYINSIGMRVPRLGEGRMFFHRLGRKIRSLRRGLVGVGDGFSVFSPVVAPGRIGSAMTGWTLAGQIRRAARRCGITRPLVWVACPPGADVVGALDPEAVVYQRTDRYECFPGVDAARVGAWDGRLKSTADLTVFCSGSLYAAESGDCRRAAYVDHGVDFDRFAEAGRSGRTPADVAEIDRPRIGFIGGIDSHTFDPDLFVDVARRCGDMRFVLVGACSLPAGWCDLPNVHLLGRKPYEQVADYMAACDVLIMPWNRGEWIRACNPVKLKEYLAVGRPVVTTPFDELSRYEGFVRVAEDAAGFADRIRAALNEPGDPDRLRARVREQTWAAKANSVVAMLDESRLREGAAA